MDYIYPQIYGEELWPQGEAVPRQQAPEGAFSKLWSGFSLYQFLVLKKINLHLKL